MKIFKILFLISLLTVTDALAGVEVQTQEQPAAQGQNNAQQNNTQNNTPPGNASQNNNAAPNATDQGGMVTGQVKPEGATPPGLKPSDSMDASGNITSTKRGKMRPKPEPASRLLIIKPVSEIP